MSYGEPKFLKMNASFTCELSQFWYIFQQVIDRDSALSDIEAQMKVDFEMHERKFALMRSQVLELRELLSSKSDLLRSKDQYIQQTEDQCLKLENDLFKAQKELERVINEQKELVRQGLPESMQLQGISSVTDVIRIQGKIRYSGVYVVLFFLWGDFCGFHTYTVCVHTHINLAPMQISHIQ